MAKNKNKRKKLSPVVINWGNNKEVKSQNSMSDYRNPYEHLNATSFEKNEEQQGNYTVLFRGTDNHAPQKDLQLGKRSITQKRIAEKLAQLVKGKGIEFIVDPDLEEGSEEYNLAQQIIQEEVNKWLDMGLYQAVEIVANGLVHQNLASIVITQKPEFNQQQEAVIPKPVHFQAHPSEWLRYSPKKMNSDGKFFHKWHYYHETWGFRGFNEKCYFNMPRIIPIESYISEDNEDADLSQTAFAIKNIEVDDNRIEKFVSSVCKMSPGIYDNAYPLPTWKANSSINDIQAEFESSCIRIDYLRNGMHIFAVVNVYSTIYNTSTENDFDSSDEQWAEDLEIIKQLKGSYNSGRIIVNPLGTDDPNMDGKIEVEKIELPFPVDQVKYFNEEARAAILTAWGVSADLFSVTKPEKNNLRSQAQFLELMIIQLQETIAIYQNPIENHLNWLLKHYGYDFIKAKIKQHKNAMFLVILRDLAKDYMKVNEIRENLLNLAALNEDELFNLFLEKSGGATNSTDTNVN